MTNKGKVSVWVAFAGALALALSAPALAGPGADVIVGDIHDVQTNGVVGSTVSWSLGTTSCNKGDVPFLWIRDTNQHPVIAQNLFRVIPGANGTIRQLGQSWLKHGFTALQGNVCGFGCTAWSDGTRLGVGCSDPYSASLNGGQSSAGPKSEVNASTGLFTYPPANLGTVANLTSKRMQAQTSDVNVAGALFFGECQYVAQDDATNNNKNNNASYRRVTIAASTATTPYEMTKVDTTQRERPGIYAWRDHGLGLNTPDPSVAIVTGDVIGDGRFILASKTWQVNATTWHYEYAVHNLNSHRSGQQFRINFPAGTVISNTGFYNVPYHSGEPHSNTPWTISVAADNITWSGPTYTTGNDLTANALRWGTMYNFSFDANIAPVLTGGVQLALFRPGSNGNAVQFTAPTPGGVLVSPPSNDECANAITLVDGSYGFSTVGATSTGPDECTASSSAAINQDIWFRYVVGASGTMTISTCGSDFDTRLAVYAGACPGSTPLTAIACNDDSNCDGTAGNELQAAVSFTATAEQVLFIRVGGYQTAYGNVNLSITGPTTLGACCLFGGCSIKTAAECTGTFVSVGSQCDTGTCPIPANDACANAIAVSDGVPVSGSTIAGTDDGGSSCGSSTTTPDMWYAYTPAVNASVTFSTCAGSDYDTVLSIHTACPVGATTNQITNACNDDTSGCGSGRQSRITVALTAGTRYLVRVTGWNGNTGNFTLLVTGGQGVAPPTNDNCSGRIGVNAGVYSISTVSATTDGPAHASCLSRGDNTIDKDIWFNYPSTGAGMLTVQVCATTAALDPFISVYDGYGCTDFEIRLMGCNDQSSACGGTNNATLTVPVVNGTSYTIRVGGYNNTSGPATMTLSFNGTTGACCESTSVCHLVAGSAACTGAGGSYQGDNSTCEGTTNNPITCCPANFDQTAGVNSDDLFAFLDDWFAQNGLSGPGFSTDINQSGNVDSDDLFGFLDIWFAACGG